jgi:hypothetical protein
MNAVEIEAAISELALQPFDAAKFPSAFLAAFGIPRMKGFSPRNLEYMRAFVVPERSIAEVVYDPKTARLVRSL